MMTLALISPIYKTPRAYGSNSPCHALCLLKKHGFSMVKPLNHHFSQFFKLVPKFPKFELKNPSSLPPFQPGLRRLPQFGHPPATDAESRLGLGTWPDGPRS